MSYKACLRKNATGEERVKAFAENWEEWSPFLWSHGGNYGCDCNRYLFFERAGGIEPDMDDKESRPCGDTRYTVLWVELEDGTRIDGKEIEEYP